MKDSNNHVITDIESKRCYKVGGKTMISKKTLWLFNITLSLFLIVGVVASFYWNNQADAEEITYIMGHVEKGDLAVTFNNVGIIKHAKESRVESTVNGTVSQIYVKGNEIIKAGDSILKIDDSNIQIQLEQAYNDLEIEQLKLANLLRTTVDKINKTPVEKILTITAPIDGIVQYTLQEGVYVTSNTEVITIVDNKYIYFVMDLFQSDLKNIKVGQEVEIYLNDFSGSVLGTIEKISKIARQKDNYLVHDARVRVQNPGLLKPEMKGTAHIKTTIGLMVKEGKFSDLEKTQLYPTISGKIEKIYVDNGENVTKGTPLLKIEGTELINQVENQKKVINSLHLKLKELKLQQNNPTIKSPTDGIVKDLFVVQNQAINPNTEIVRIVEDNLVASLEINEQDIGKIKLGQEVMLEIPSYSKNDIKGKVTHISDTGILKEDITIYEVQVSFPQNEEIKEGMTVNSSILIDIEENVLMVPTASLIDVESGKVIRVLMDDQIIIKKVELGISNDTMTQITSGMKPTDIIITSISNNSAK